MEEYLEEQHREAMRQSIVEQERQRLLREHAAKLLGYLPKVGPPPLHALVPSLLLMVLLVTFDQGVLRDDKDLEMLGDGFKDAYTKKPDMFDDF